MKGILGRKIGMTQVFTKTGKAIPVTAIEVTPNVITQVKNKESDGYDATQLAFSKKRENIVNKPMKGHFAKANSETKRFVKEIRNMKGYEFGSTIDASIFEKGEFVDVRALTKGKGFSGVIKRHNHSRGPMGHGSGYHRGVGSMGAVANNRIFKGKKLPGQYGHEQVSVQNLQVVDYDLENNYILIKGAVPGPKKSLVIITQAIKNIKKIKSIELVNNEVKGDK